jgi:hypothetical protein
MEIRNMKFENDIATHLATKPNEKLTRRIQKRGFKIFHNGRDLRLWPEGLETAAQKQYLLDHRQEVFQEVHSLWANPIRCLDCQHHTKTCELGITQSIHEGGFHPTDLHHCKGFI